MTILAKLSGAVAEREPYRSRLGPPGSPRLDQGNDSNHDQQQEAEQEGSKEDVTNGAKKSVVISNAVVRVTQGERDHGEDHDRNGNTDQNPAADNHPRTLPEFR